MIHKVEVLVVEDEFIVAEDIRRNLIKLGYSVKDVAKNGKDAIEIIKQHAPDIVLLDITLGGDMNGIEVAEEVRKIARIPIIFVTAHSDTSTFDRAKHTAPDAYIIKPFNFNNLHSAIELAIYNYARNDHSREQVESNIPKEEKPGHYLYNGSIFIKSGKGFEKVKLAEVFYIKADGSYCKLFTEKREFTLAMNLHTVLDRLSRPEFLRVHRSYVVQLNNIEKIEEGGVRINNIFIPTSKKMHDDLLRKFESL